MHAAHAIDSEAELLGRARTGDEGAFAAIMRRCNRRLFRAARSILKDDGEAEEAVQEAYLRGFTRLHDFTGQSSVVTWLTRIAINEALARLRRRRVVESLDALAEAAVEDAMKQHTAASANPEQMAARAEMRALIEAAIDQLPDDLRSVFVLRAVEDLPTAETALLLGLPEQTVKTRFHRARQRLRQGLGRQAAATLPDAFAFDGHRCDRVVEAVLTRLSTKGNKP